MTIISFKTKLQVTAFTTLVKYSSTYSEFKNRNCVTFELVEDSPEFSNVSGKRDVCVQDNDSLQVGQ